MMTLYEKDYAIVTKWGKSVEGWSLGGNPPQKVRYTKWCQALPTGCPVPNSGVLRICNCCPGISTVIVNKDSVTVGER